MFPKIDSKFVNLNEIDSGLPQLTIPNNCKFSNIILYYFYFYFLLFWKCYSASNNNNNIEGEEKVAKLLEKLREESRLYDSTL